MGNVSIFANHKETYYEKLIVENGYATNILKSYYN